jgi:hypothetical protein
MLLILYSFLTGVASFFMQTKIKELLGKTLWHYEGKVGGETIMFWDNVGFTYEMFHDQSCCEHVYVEDIVGDLGDLLHSPILEAEEVVNENKHGVNPELEQRKDSFTWTFYKLATIKGSVTIRWFGCSNGYYSESVQIRKGYK